MAAQALNNTTSQDYAAGASAIVAAESVFDTVDDLGLYRDRWAQRCALYGLRRAYHRGTVYDDPILRQQLRLYAGVRQIFGPLRRAVRVDVALVPSAWSIDKGSKSAGRKPVPPKVAEAVEQIRTWSTWRRTYAAAVLYGAVAGELGLLVVDDQLAKLVQIVALRPDEVVTGTMRDGRPFGLVIKPGMVDRNGRHEYAALYTEQEIRTYRNGQPHDYDGGGARRPNLQRRIPVLLVPYLVGEDGIGENTFAGAAELLDRANEITSLVLDTLGRNAEPLTVFSGVDQVSMDEENNAIVLNKAEAKAYTIDPKLATDQALALIERMLVEFKNVLPQLILDQLSARNDLAYDTVVTLCMELIAHVQDVRTNLDSAIETAERWAIEAGQLMGLWPGVDPGQHKIDPDRPVLTPPPSQRLQLQAGELGLAAAAAGGAPAGPGQAAPSADQDARKGGAPDA